MHGSLPGTALALTRRGLNHYKGLACCVNRVEGGNDGRSATAPAREQESGGASVFGRDSHGRAPRFERDRCLVQFPLSPFRTSHSSRMASQLPPP